MVLLAGVSYAIDMNYDSPRENDIYQIESYLKKSNNWDLFNLKKCFKLMSTETEKYLKLQLLDCYMKAHSLALKHSITSEYN